MQNYKPSFFRPISSVYGKIDSILLAAWEFNPNWESRFKGILKVFEDREIILFGIFDPERIQGLSKDHYPINSTSDFGMTSKSTGIPLELFNQLFISNEDDMLLFEEFIEAKSRFWLPHGNPSQITDEANFGDRVEKKTYILNNFDLKRFFSDINLSRKSLSRLEIPKIGSWIQDPFIILQNEFGQVAFLEPFYYSRGFGYQFVAEQVAEELDLPIFPFRMVLDGGNMLFEDDFALIGKNLLYEAFLLDQGAQSSLEVEQARKDFIEFADNYQDASLVRIVQYYRRRLNLRGKGNILWIGSSENASRSDRLLPLVHIDMIISLVGRCDISRKSMVLLAKPRKIGNNFSNEDKKKILEIEKELDIIRCQLEESEFIVIRIPLAVEKDTKLDRLVYRSYNNSLVEIYEEEINGKCTGKLVRMIYLPEYGNHQYELEYHNLCQEVTAILSRIEFQVTVVPGPFDAWARSNGSLHCKTKVLARSPFYHRDSSSSDHCGDTD